MMQTIKAMEEADKHGGPAIIIAYATCVEHGIKTGMNCSMAEQKLAVDCGYQILMRYDGTNLNIDSKEPNFDLYENFLNNEVRFNALKIKNPKEAEKILASQKEAAIARYKYYQNLK